MSAPVPASGVLPLPPSLPPPPAEARPPRWRSAELLAGRKEIEIEHDGAIYRLRCTAAFPLSDHADFPSLLHFVELVQPKRVLTLHGFAREFAATLRARGVDALALGHANQLDLSLSV